MEFEFDEDQRLLQQLVRETVAKARALPADELWTTYLELGWLEAPPVELAIVLEELGYAADPTPFLATATWFAPLAGRLPQGSGTGVCDGTGRFVLDAARADRRAEFLVAGRTWATTLHWLERSTAARIRAFVEARGLRGRDPLAQAPARTPTRAGRPPTSVLGALLDRDGPEALGPIVAALADEHGGKVYSNDTDFARFPGIAWQNPLR